MRRVMIPVAAAGLLVVAQAPAQEAEPVGPVPQLVSVGTAAVSGMYFPVGVALCRLVNQHRRETGLRCAARPSGGSVANVGGLRDGAFELALVQSDTQAEAVAGIGAFAAVGPSDDLRAVMSLYPEALTLVVRADSGIERVEDLAGKRVWLGGEGSGTRDLAGDLLEALGWTEASLAEVPEVSTDRLGDALCHDEIAGFFYAIGHPALAIQEATTECDARLVAVDGAAIDALVSTRADLVQTTIPGGIYRGNPGGTETFGVVATLVTRADQPDERIGAMVGEIFDDFEMLRGLEPVLAELSPEAMVSDGLAAPLHPGAERYYRERGWLD